MKQRTSFILKGLISLVLSLVMLCGTAVTSLSAVTVDLAETGDFQPVTEPPLMDGDIVGSSTSGYYLEESGSGWKITNGSKYLKVDFGGGIKIQDTGSVFSVKLSDNAFVFSGKDDRNNIVYLEYNNGFKGSNTEKTVSVYRNIVTYTVTFDANGGSGTMTSQTITGVGNLKANEFRHSKYSFESWNTKADGTGEVYADGATVNFNTPTTLYAQWNSNKTFYFSNNKSWPSVYAYMWKDADNSVKTEWPGDQLTEIRKNAYGDGIFSVTVDLEKYDRIIFNNGTEGTSSGSKTVDISLSADMNTGIYCADTQYGDAFNVYTYPYPISYSKQIEKINASDPDDYNYCLHLTVDGATLTGEADPDTGKTKKQNVALIIDASDTMRSTSDTGSAFGKDKLKTIQELLKSDNGFIEKYMDGNNSISIIFITGESGNGTSYTSLRKQVATDTDDIDDTRGSWADNYRSTSMSYNTAFLAANEIYGNKGEDYSIVFITGNKPNTYVNMSTGLTDWSVSGERIQTQTISDCQGFLNNHTNVTFYAIGVASQNGDIERGSDTIKAIANNAQGGGGYYPANSIGELTDALTSIVNQILPDKTTGLTVTDVLSDNVVLADTPNLSATLYTNPSNRTWGTTSTEITPTVSADRKTITYTNPGTITGPYKLEITFNIKTADGIFMDTAKYPETGYPNTGDEDTDFGGNNTSSGQPGYYSNANATLSYTLNGSQSTMTFARPVVQAPVGGKYIFKYKDRYNQTRTVTVPVTLNSSEKDGYSGNGNQKGVPTYIWNTASKGLFDNNPLLAAALVVQGNAENWKNVDVYKNTIAWGIGDSGATNLTVDATNHTVTVTATVTKNVFKVLLYQGDNLLETVNNVAYGEVVTFLEQYDGQTGYRYVNKDILPEGVKYWSSDKDGEFPLTTNPTFGMVIRGNEGNPDETTVKVYAQTDTSKLSNIASWAPKFEEADLTYSNDDNTDKQKYYADYLANYFSKDGVVIQDVLKDNPNNIKYGVIVVKSDFNYSVDKTKLITALGTMRTKNYKSAALNSSKTIVAYRSEYDDEEHISNFNRTWYTFTFAADGEKMEGKKLTAMAYIQVGSDMYYSELNTDLVTAKTQTSEP